jgi:hypothetical protein
MAAVILSNQRLVRMFFKTKIELPVIGASELLSKLFGGSQFSFPTPCSVRFYSPAKSLLDGLKSISLNFAFGNSKIEKGSICFPVQKTNTNTATPIYTWGTSYSFKSPSELNTQLLNVKNEGNLLMLILVA